MVLHIATQYGHLEMVKYLVEQRNVDVNTKNTVSMYLHINVLKQSIHISNGCGSASDSSLCI